MKQIKLLATFLIVMLCAGLTACSDDCGDMGKYGNLKEGKMTVKLIKAGTLKALIPAAIDKDSIHHLTIIGDLNGTDFGLIKGLSDYLYTLDLSQANIVSGGEPYGYTLSTTDNVIGITLFTGLRHLETLLLPNAITRIDKKAFYGCISLTSIRIPNSVTSIGESAFKDCNCLNSVILNDSLTSIDNFTFYEVTGLSSITIPNSVTSIGYYTFYNCRGLKSVTIGHSVPKIDICTFEGCTNLTTVTIGSSVTSIGNYAFHGCKGLKEIHNKNRKPQELGTKVFENVDMNLCTLYVPKGTLSDYQNDSYWKGLFANVVEEE